MRVVSIIRQYSSSETDNIAVFQLFLGAKNPPSYLNHTTAQKQRHLVNKGLKVCISDRRLVEHLWQQNVTCVLQLEWTSWADRIHYKISMTYIAEFQEISHCMRNALLYFILLNAHHIERYFQNKFINLKDIYMLLSAHLYDYE